MSAPMLTAPRSVRYLLILVATLLLGATFALGTSPDHSTARPKPAIGAGAAVAIFAGGCFWCMESAFDALDGVIETTPGYSGGAHGNPTYEDVASGATGHAEVVQVIYDPKRIGYQRLLDVFWRNIDPTVRDRQFCDRGSQYRSAIFYTNAEQKRLAEDSRAALEKTKPFKEPIVTEIVAAGEFYPAEEYHHDFYLKNPIRYRFYRANCGRDARLEQLWGRVTQPQ